ncbi:MAG: serine/threonine protein kinase, partial [Myxococcaceae bacterium]|nr:serine/threonine protein kinase [Myxococcaceae bacterium]
MGRVYEARHTRLERTVAIKLLRPEQAKDAGLVQRFFQEARTVNRINHPHIVEISDFIEDTDDEGRPRAWCVMEFLEGETLTAMLARGPMPLERALRIADQVCRALSAAHGVGVIHRDLKPDNIVITRGPDGRDFAKVLDFGVAKLMMPDPAIQAVETHEGVIVGTPRYMPPEQAAGLEVDPRADIYGVGCLLYEMFAGRPAFDGTSFAHLMARIITAPPPPLGPMTASGEPLAPELRTLVLQCLEKDPDLRPQSFDEVRARLAFHSTRHPRRAVPRALVASAGIGTLALALVALRPAPPPEPGTNPPVPNPVVAQEPFVLPAEWVATAATTEAPPPVGALEERGMNASSPPATSAERPR